MRRNREYIGGFIFVLLMLVIVAIAVYFFYQQYLLYKNQRYSHQLREVYHVSSLYPVTSEYTAIPLSNQSAVIGLLEIPKLNLSYPILSESTEETLKISVCRFSRSHAKSYWKHVYCWSQL